jgi:hypothetical protein
LEAQKLKDEERRTGMTGRGLIGQNRKTHTNTTTNSNRPNPGAAVGTNRSINVYLTPKGDKGSNPEIRLGVSSRDFPENVIFYGEISFNFDLLDYLF